MVYTRISVKSHISTIPRDHAPARFTPPATQAGGLDFASTSRGRSPTISKWKIGWRTPFWMGFFYMLALFFAFLHLGLFLYLNQRQADGADRAAPQSYVSTASNLLSGVFGMSLKASLAIAFTQYLWYTLRNSTLRVSTIESLFQVRSNLFLAFDRIVVAQGPVLVFIAVFICAIPITTSFPPGALTISTTNRTWTNLTAIPTYNASFIGNGSGYDADRYSFVDFEASFPENVTIVPTSVPASPFFGDLNNVYVQQLATHILVTGMPTSMPSPCGANCSYLLVLDIPYLQCNTTTQNITRFFSSPPPTAPKFDTTWQNYVFKASSYFGIDYRKNSTSYRIESLICSPARANYTLEVLYNNNIQRMNVMKGLVAPLNLSSPAPKSPMLPYNTMFPGFMGITQSRYEYFGIDPLHWTPPFLSWYRDLQLLTLIAGMAKSLAGSIDTANQVNGTMVRYTRMCNIYGNYSYFQNQPYSIHNITANDTSSPNLSNIDPEEFHVTPELLNSALLNITLSVITDFGRWYANDTEVIRWSSINVYDFSRPLNLIIPYFLSLIITIPILFIGAFALRANGVAAIDGGFTQLLTTTTGSKALEKAAAVGCLGGEENVPEQLKELEVRFGELVSEKGVVRRAGFGTREETRELVRGRVYGAA